MSSEVRRAGDLDISEDMAFQRRSWRIQRIGWVIMALLLVAALLGLFGGGMFSRATAGSEDDALWLEYERFARLLKPGNLKIHVGAIESESIRLWISQDYLESVEIDHITPTEASAEAAEDGVFYTFETSGQPITILINLRAVKPGLVSGEVRLDGGPSREFTQFVYP